MAKRNGIRIGLWLLAVFGGLAGVSLILWGLLTALGDPAGAVVARVLSYVWIAAWSIDFVSLVVLLACLQLEMLERDPPKSDA